MRELKTERIREMTEDDILTKIRELKEELFHLGFRNTMRQLQNPLLLRERKRDVARLETILNEHRKGIRPLVLGPGTAPAGAAASRAAAPARAETKTKAAAKGKAGAKSAPVRSKPAAKSQSRSATSKKKGKKA